MQRRSFIADIAPWLIWTILFVALAAIGTRHGTQGPVTNPRSLSAATTTAAATDSAKASLPDCGGESLAEKGNGREKK